MVLYCAQKETHIFVFNFMQHLIFRNLQNQNSKKVICDNVETVELGVRVGCRGEGRVKGVGV